MRQDKLWAARILTIASAAASATLAGACGGTISNEGDAASDASNPDADHKHDGASTDARNVKDSARDVSIRDVSANDGTDDVTASDVTTDDVKADAPRDMNAPEVLTVRRPFLVGSSMRAASAAVRDDWSDELPPAAGLDETARAVLARAWLDDALQEHASIAAFARFAMQMLAVGAPSDLVMDAQRAAIDEVRHARVCFSLARRYGETETGPSVLRVDDALGPMTLADLAALTAEEGCVGETLGALLAKEQATVARDPVVRRLLDRIARDEARHAELAWRFVAWAVARGGEEVLAAVEAAVTRALATTLAMEVRPLRVDSSTWAAHGRLSCAEARAVAASGAHDVVLPAVRAMRLGRSGRAPVRRSGGVAAGLRG
jgi:hypothetical protein